MKILCVANSLIGYNSNSCDAHCRNDSICPGSALVCGEILKITGICIMITTVRTAHLYT